MKIHTGDMVVVISGAEKGQSGKVMSVNREKNRILVEGINMVYKHVKPSQKNPQGGRLHKEMPINASNVKVLCPKTSKPTRVGYRYLKDGSKERYARSSGESMGMISPPKPQYAARK